jgi:PAS domain S-box-containing protein
MLLQEAMHPDDVERAMTELRQAVAEAARGEHTWHRVRFRQARKDASWADVEALFTARGRLLFGIRRVRQAVSRLHARSRPYKISLRCTFDDALSSRAGAQDATGASAAQRAVKELLLSTSFDLRCSATSIVSAASLLRARPSVQADAEAAFLADAVRTSCDMLSGLAANVLELRRLERGELRVSRVPFCVRDTLRAVIQMCHMAKCGGAELVWEDEERAAAALPPLVEGDTVLIGLVVQNLCTNAVKFANNTRVTVRVALEEPPPDAPPPTLHTLRVDVEDRGVGVAPADFERIFAKYERAPQEQGGGAGLGLHISRGFARAMGGDVTLRSALGQGSTFTLCVPVRVLDATEAAAAAAAAAGGGNTGDAAAATAAEACRAAQEAPVPDLAARARANLQQGGGALRMRSGADVDPFAEVSLDEMLLALLAESGEIFVYMHPLRRDTMSRLAYVSPSVRSVLGYDPASLIDKHGTWMLHPDDIEKHAAATAAMWARDAPSECAMSFGMRRVRHADGSYLWMNVEAARVGDVYYALLRDATRSKANQRSLKEYLLATSHDMRTPVTGIIAAAELLSTRESVRADAEAAFLVQTIRSCGQLMNSVISNVMELRSLGEESEGSTSSGASAAHSLVLRPVPFDPKALADAVLADTCAAMGHTGRALAVEAPARLPACVRADAERMQRMFQNMFSELLRHATDDAALRIRLTCVPIALQQRRSERGAAGASSGSGCDSDNDDDDGGDDAELRLEVCDAARHIDDAGDFERMTTPYYSARMPDSSAGGAGSTHSSLALCVTRVFAHAMGGVAAAERLAPPGAPPPSGIAIRLRVPVRAMAPPPEEASGATTTRTPELKRASPGDDTPKPRAAETPPPSPMEVTPVAAAAARPKHILLVEDHALILKLVSKLLRAAGFQVSTAVNGAEGLAALQAAPELPDAVLTDVQARSHACMHARHR